MAKKSLTIFSFNFAGLPLITKNYQTRLNYLLVFLPKVKADVFCLQEVWSRRARKKIINQLSPLGWNHYYQVSSLRPNGLLTISRYPISQGRFYPTKGYFYDFKRLVMESPLFLKGYQLIDLVLPEETVKMFNLHFRINWGQELRRESRPGKVGRQAIRELIDRVNLLGRKKIILAGDFNIQPQKELYNQLIDLAKVKPVSPTKGKMVLPVIFRWPIAPGSGITDHIFIKNFPNSSYQTQIIADQEIAPGVYLSDHAAILTTIFWH